MTRVTQIFKAKPKHAQATSLNREGYPAWERPLEEQYVQTLMTNTFGNTFYAQAGDLLAEAEAVHTGMLAKDPAFAAKALPFARNKGFMRTQPVYGLARLAAVEGVPFAEVFNRVILTPNDLSDFTAIIKSLRKGEGGRKVKRVAGRWLIEKMTEYWAIKYGADRSGGYSLGDLLQVYHPDAGRPIPLFSYLLGKEVDLAELPQVAAFERLKRATTAEEKIAAISEGRLPHEVVTPFAGDSKQIWSALVPQMPVFALLRHLASLERHGVLDASRGVIEGKLTSAEVIRNSKILPFRFLEAQKHVQSAWAKDALRDALELSFVNLAEIEGRTAVFLDRSGSMAGNYMQIAAIFAVSLMKKANLNGRVLLFDDKLEEFAVSMRDSVLTQAGQIQARGGTDTSLPMKKLLEERDRVDNIILITDEQQNRGNPFVDVLEKYREKVNRNVKTFIVDVSPYRNALTSPDPLTWYMYGWSDTVLTFISLATQGWGSMVKAIREGAL